MSLMDKFMSFLFGPPPEDPAEDPLLSEQAPAAQAAPEVPSDPSLVEISPDHPLYKLYELRRKENNSHLYAPKVSLDEFGVLPPELVKQEKKRIQPALRNAANARLKAAKGTKKSKDDDEPLALDAEPWFFISADKLYAWTLVFPPVGEGQELSRDSFYRGMFGQDISFGVDTRLADRMAHEEKRYFQLYLIAHGKPAFDGKNGNIVDYFPREVQRIFEVDEFDQVDYTALNLIHNVKEGQEICRLILPTEGEPGRTVQDQEIPAKSGKSVPLPKGRNTEISEDGVSLVATISGHVEFTGRSFQVRPVMDVAGDVDYSVGDINFLGDVNIKGDVRTGFTVRASGNIQVGGMIEAGSTVEAGGDLVVVKGILGDGNTVIRAQRCLFSKYIENATVYVRENLQTDCILNGNVYCNGEVQVRSGRGSIMGGRIWAADKISATAVGSKSECRTAVSLGGMPCENFELEYLRQELKKLEMEQEELECQMDSPSKSSLLSKTRMKLTVTEHKLRQLEEDMPQPDAAAKKNNGRLECGVAYPGTELTFGEELLRLRHESRQCVVRLINGEIVVI